MKISFTKIVSNVDFGTFGKRNLRVEISLSPNKDNKYALDCSYVYVLFNDGKYSPVQDNVYTQEWLMQVVNQCLEEAKGITEWVPRR